MNSSTCSNIFALISFTVFFYLISVESNLVDSRTQFIIVSRGKVEFIQLIKRDCTALVSYHSTSNQYNDAEIHCIEAQHPLIYLQYKKIV